MRTFKREILRPEERDTPDRSVTEQIAPGGEHALAMPREGVRAMKNSTWFSCQLLMDVGVVAPSDETPALQLHAEAMYAKPMTAFQLDMAEDENGEIDFWRLALAQGAEAQAANWGFELETPDLEESRLRKKAMVEVERRHDGFLMPDDCEEWAEFRKEVNAEVRRLKREAAGTKEKEAK